MGRTGRRWEHARPSLGLKLGLRRSQKHSFDQTSSISLVVVTLLTRDKNGTPVVQSCCYLSPIPCSPSLSSNPMKHPSNISNIHHRPTNSAQHSSSSSCKRAMSEQGMPMSRSSNGPRTLPATATPRISGIRRY